MNQLSGCGSGRGGVETGNQERMEMYGEVLQSTLRKSSVTEVSVVVAGAEVVTGSGHPSSLFPSAGVYPSGQHPNSEDWQTSDWQPWPSGPSAGVIPSGQHWNSASWQVSNFGQPVVN